MTNPYRCMKCRQPSFASSADPSGLCPWCRAELTERVKTAHVNAMYDRLMED